MITKLQKSLNHNYVRIDKWYVKIFQDIRARRTKILIDPIDWSLGLNNLINSY